MKKILFTLLVCAPALAYRSGVDCSATNILQTYSTSYPSLSASLSSLPAGQAHMLISNPSSTRICVDTGQNAASAPNTGGINEHCIPSGAVLGWDFVTINGYVFVRADGANCTSGIVDIDVW